MSRCVVTGGAGFIGSHLCETLAKQGQSVVAIDNLSLGDSNVQALQDAGVELVIADIGDYKAIEPAFANADVVYHLAAMNRAPRSIEDPLASNKTNITGTLHVLEAMRAHNVPLIIFAGSSSVYEQKHGVLKEDDNVKPPHPYGVGKLASEHYLRVYHELFGITYCTLRFFSVYGPRQLGDITHAGVVARFIKQAIHKEALTVFGDGEQKRNFTYVADVVRCCMLAAKTPKAHNTTINIANPTELSVIQLANIVLTQTHSSSKIVHEEKRSGDPVRNAADITRMKELLDFTPEFTFEKGIQQTITWYEENK